MNKKQKIILIVLGLVCVSLTALLCVNDFALADDTIRTLELVYPEIPEADTPGADPFGERTTLPQYIKYLFNFGIAIGGILAFLVLVFGGFIWMTSSGNPTAIQNAKTKMFGGIIGLCLLFGSYLIIDRINPDLTSLKDMDDMLPTTGIHLCAEDAHCEINDPDKRKRYSGNIPKFPGDVTNPDNFNPNRACFISHKNELMSIFVHSEEGYKGTIKREIKNTKDSDNPVCGGVADGKSLSFLWNKPGIYLYEQESFGVKGADKIPKYLRGGAKNLDEWKNITKSLKCVYPNESTGIFGFLFSEPDYSGQCETFINASIFNLNVYPLVNGTLSSIYAFTIDFSRPGIEGEVKFYDQLNCKGNSFEVPVEGGNMGDYSAIFDKGNFSEHQFEPSGESADGRVMSFRINGPFIVMITTSEDPSDENIECQAFTKPNETNCYDSIITSNVYSETDTKLRPRAYYVVPSN